MEVPLVLYLTEPVPGLGSRLFPRLYTASTRGSAVGRAICLCHASKCFAELSVNSSSSAPEPANSCGKRRKAVKMLFYFRSCFFTTAAVCLPGHLSSPRGRGEVYHRTPLTASSPKVETSPRARGHDGTAGGVGGGVTALGCSDGCQTAEGAHCSREEGGPAPLAGQRMGRAGAVLPPVRVGAGAGSGAAAAEPAAAP